MLLEGSLYAGAPGATAEPLAAACSSGLITPSPLRSYAAKGDILPYQPVPWGPLGVELFCANAAANGMAAADANTRRLFTFISRLLSGKMWIVSWRVPDATSS